MTRQMLLLDIIPHNFRVFHSSSSPVQGWLNGAPIKTPHQQQYKPEKMQVAECPTAMQAHTASDPRTIGRRECMLRFGNHRHRGGAG